MQPISPNIRTALAARQKRQTVIQAAWQPVFRRSSHSATLPVADTVITRYRPRAHQQGQDWSTQPIRALLQEERDKPLNSDPADRLFDQVGGKSVFVGTLLGSPTQDKEIRKRYQRLLQAMYLPEEAALAVDFSKESLVFLYHAQDVILEMLQTRRASDETVLRIQFRRRTVGTKAGSAVPGRWHLLVIPHRDFELNNTGLDVLLSGIMNGKPRVILEFSPLPEPLTRSEESLRSLFLKKWNPRNRQRTGWNWLGLSRRSHG